MDRHPLDVGAQVLCPHCRQWHPVVRWHTEGTEYTLAMRYFECRGDRYYAGQQGLFSRHPTWIENASDGTATHPRDLD